MKIIDRKALVSALIMACGNGVLASEEMGLTDGAGASATAAPRVEEEFKEADGLVKERLISDMLGANTGLETFRDNLNKLTLPALKGVQTIFSGMNPDQQTKTMDSLISSGEAHINAIATHAPEVFKDMPLFAKINSIGILTGVDADKIEGIAQAIACATPLILEMGLNFRVAIIRALAVVDEDKIVPRIKAIKDHTTALREGMENHEQSIIVAAFAGVDADEIGPRARAIKDHAEKLFEGVNKRCHAEIIEAFARVHEDEIGPRVEAIDGAFQLLEGIIGRENIIFLLVDVDTAEILERANAVRVKLPQLNTILAGIRAISLTELIISLLKFNVPAIEAAVSQLKPGMSSDEILAVIHAPSQAVVPSGGASAGAGGGSAGASSETPGESAVSGTVGE